jgi:hypothetical protein
MALISNVEGGAWDGCALEWCDRRIIGAGSCLAIEGFEWPMDIACAVD